MKLTICIAALALVGCATSTGIYQAAPDTFGVSTSASFGRGGLTAAREAAYQQAAAKCDGAKVQTVAEKPASITPTDGMAHFDLSFTCQRQG
jgi:hypothetical protein